MGEQDEIPIGSKWDAKEPGPWLPARERTVKVVDGGIVHYTFGVP